VLVKKVAGLVCTVLAASSLVSSASAAPIRTDVRSQVEASESLRSTTPSRVPGEVVVRYEAGTSPATRADLRDDVEAESVERLELARTEVLEVAPGAVEETIAELSAAPGVAFAEPNFIYTASAAPNDPRYAQEWGLNNTGQSISGSSGTADADIDAPEAWEYTTGSSDVVVAVIDTGVAMNHPDLANNIWINPGESGEGKESNNVDDDGNGKKDDWRGWDFVDSDNTPRDLYGHGTHVAGTVGATGNDGFGVTGVAWDVSLMPLRVLGADGSGTTADVASAISYAAQNGADIINLSLGGADFSLSVSNAIAAATGSLVVAAAGNDGRNVDVTASYPCNYASANIVCVGASDFNDTLAGYSNYGVVNVDLVAPGTRVISAVPPFQRPLSEGFESDLSEWTTGGVGTAWSRDVDTLGYFAADSVGGNYQANSDSWLATAEPTDLSGQESCRLAYYFSLQTERNADYFYVDVSTDGTTWTNVGGWTGSTDGDWLSAGHDLSAYDGASLDVRFRLNSNGLLNFNGASIDDVEIRCLRTSYIGNEFSYYSGTSMAAPHVAGAAALMLTAAPDATPAALKASLLSSVDAVSNLTGKSVTGGRLNLQKAILAIAPGVTPTEDPSPSASPTIEPSPDAEPTPPIEDPVVVEHPRTVTLRLKGHLKVSGRVSDGVVACAAGVQVQIRRNGVVLKTLVTDAAGLFSSKVRDRRGRYVAKVLPLQLPGQTCLGDSSPVKRHRHG
jgi:subtilisin family serine protease